MDKIYLREVELGDLASINKWRNDYELVSFLGANYFFISEVIDRKWYDNYLANRDKNVRLAIIETESNTLIGLVNLTGIHAINRSAEFSIMIGEKDYWSKSYGSIAVKKMVEHGFNDLNLHRIYLTVLSDNIRAIKSYEKSGFKSEGVLRDSVFKGGDYHDMVIMSRLKSDK